MTNVNVRLQDSEKRRKSRKCLGIIQNDIFPLEIPERQKK